MEQQTVGAQNIDAMYPTVRALLADTLMPENYLGSGLYASGYKFPDALGLPFVLRARKDLDREQLLSTTSLVSLPELFCGPNFGQALMVQSSSPHQDLSIMQRQYGTPFSEISASAIKRYPSDPDARAKAAIDVIGMLRAHMASGGNPFISVLQSAAHLKRNGVRPDLSANNLLFDEKGGSISLVDQLPISRDQLTHRPVTLFHHGIRNDVYYDASRVMTEISNYSHVLNTLDLQSDLGKRYLAETDWLLARTQEAAKQVSAINANEVPEALAFRSTGDVKAIALTDPPSKLVAELNRLAGLTTSPAR